MIKLVDIVLIEDFVYIIKVTLDNDNEKNDIFVFFITNYCFFFFFNYNERDNFILL